MAVGVTLPVPRLLKAPCQQGPHVKGSPTHSPWKPWSQCQGFSEQGPPLLPSSTYNSLAQDKPALNFCFADSCLWKPFILVVLCVQWYLTIHIGLSLREAKRCLCHEEVIYDCLHFGFGVFVYVLLFLTHFYMSKLIDYIKHPWHRVETLRILNFSDTSRGYKAIKYQFSGVIMCMMNPNKKGTLMFGHRGSLLFHTSHTTIKI